MFLMINLTSLGQKKLRLGTGSKGANYYRLGLSIDSIIRESGMNVKIEVIETKGSVDNITKLDRGEIDLAIIQNDIGFIADNGIKVPRINGLRGIMSFYHEPIFIISNKPNILLENLSNFEVNIGEIESGLAANAQKILQTVGIWENVTKWNYHPLQVVDKLKNNEIQISFVNNIPDVYRKALENEDFYILPISEKWVKVLMDSYSYFTESGSYSINKKSYKTVSVKAMMICKKDLEKALVYDLTKILNENYENFDIPKGFENEEEILTNMPLRRWHAGSFKYYREGRKLNSVILNKVMWVFLFFCATIIVFFIILNLAYIRLKGRFDFLFFGDSLILRIIKKSNKYLIRFKYLMIVFLMITLFMTNVFFMKRAESKWVRVNNQLSWFDDNSYGEIMLWLFVFGSSGYEDNEFPKTPIGKILATMIPLIGIGGILAIGGLITNDYIRRKKMEIRGEKAMKFKNHIIICGWNSNVPLLVKSLLNRKIIHPKRVVILGNCTNERYLETEVVRNNVLCYVQGDAWNKADLQKAGFHNAEIAIIICDELETNFNQDSQSILKILAIEQYCIELEEAGLRDPDKNIYTIAEIKDPKNFELAKMAKVDEIISFEDVKSKILSTSVHNPGASKFIKEILNYDEYNEIYNIYINANSGLIGLTYDKALNILRDDKVLLLSINVENHRKQQDAEDHKKRHNLERGVITNPFLKEELAYKVSKGDVLIVLAENGKIAERVEKKYSNS